MQTWTLIFLIFLILNFVVKLWLSTRQIRYVATHRHTVPPFFSNKIGLASHQKAADYTSVKERLGLWRLLLDVGLLLGFTLFGGIDYLSTLLPKFLHQPYWVAIGLLMVVSLISSLIELPFSLYAQFGIEARFGFNKMTVALFFIDMIKGLVLSLILGIPFLWGLLWLMEQMGTYWWVWAWIATVVFSLFIQLLYPTLIAPLFNKFEPIENPQIQSKIMALANRCHFKLGGIFVMDGSKRSGHGNAYFTGFGGNKRIVFYDTLINSLTPDEVEAVLAHELGHYKLKHIIKMLVVGVLLALIQFAILGYLKEQPWFYSGLGVSPSMQPTLANAQALLLFFMVMPLFTFFVTPLSSIFSRKHEFEADDFAAQNSNKADLITALVKMYEDNASTLTPDPVYSKIFYSHPPAFERITHLQSAGRGDVAHSAVSI